VARSRHHFHLPAEVEELLGGHAALIARLPVVTFVSDVGDRARLRYISPQIEEILGYPAQDWLGDSTLFAERLHPDDRDRVLSVLPRHSSDTSRVTDFRILARDGRTVWLSHSRVRIEGGGNRAWVGTLTDVTARKQTETALARNEQVSAAVLESLEEGLIVVDRGGDVLLANQNAADLFGIPVEDLRASSAADPPVPLFYSNGERIGGESNPALQALADGVEQRNVEVRVVRPDGDQRWMSANFLPLRSHPDEAPQGVVFSLSDITESRRVASQLAETERRLRDLAENVSAVFWIRNVETDEIHYVSPAYAEIWGRSVEALYRDPSSWIDAVHPHDRARVMAAALDGDPREYEAEYRIIRPDGAVRWVHDRAFSLRESQQHSAVVSGMAEDVTVRREAQDALVEERERSRAAFVHAPVGAALFSFGPDDPARLIEVNPAFCAMLGYSESELLAMKMTDLIHPDEVVDMDRWGRLVSGEVESYSAERKLLRSDGRALCTRMRLSVVRDADGAPKYCVTQVEDITSEKRADAQQEAIARLGKMALEGTPLESLIERAVETVNETLGTSMAGVLEYCPDISAFVPRYTVGVPDDGAPPPSQRKVAATGYLAVALAERTPVAIEDWSSEDRFEHSDFTRRFCTGGSLAVPIEGPAGTWGVLSLHTAEPRRFAQDEMSFAHAVANVLGAAIQRWRGEEDTRHRALHDPLTGLPNRALFLDRLGHALERRAGGTVAVLFMDLDHFKVINDSLGHEAGDRLLCAFAPRLQETLRPSDTVARFGGDEFVVLCEDLGGAEDAVHLAERILAGLATPLTVGSHELFTSATIGLAVARAGDTPEGLIRDADAAMYRAKARGRGRYELFDQAMRERVSERLEIENSLRRALADGDLELHFQPIVALADHSIVGAEALLRWHHPERGWISPADFIPIAEESGLIVPIGEWVLEEAARLALRWPAPAPGASQPQVAVNLSARQVAHPGFAERLGASLDRTGLPPERLSLEITETVLMEEAEAPMEAVRKIKRLGVRLVLDDFGTGYSSLSYLNRLPIDVLKLDRSFIRPLREQGDTTAAIVYGVVTMAEALGMTVVAEGVEEAAQLDKLTALGCDFAQGFLFAQPMPPAKLEALLRAGALPAPSAATLAR
jgi:diguanylate cyclase (GGDEF)-like protein/PAS domain S-box-containing protein